MRRGAAGSSQASAMRVKCYREVRKAAAFAIISLSLIMLASLCTPAAHAARTGGSAPIIHWDASMIYSGQNNGLPWGPVGENTIVHGANFNPNVQLRLVVSPGDSNGDATVCSQASGPVPVANVTTDSTGSFTQNFPWPAAANHVNQVYSICSVRASDNSLVSSKDDGPFTVLSSSPPAINISATSVAAGGTLTVSGQNWVPPQSVSVEIAGCAACDPGNTYVTSASTSSAGQNSGVFSIAITIPSSTKPGNYVVDALTKTGLEAYYTTGTKNLTITAAPTTPTPTPTPSPTMQPSPTPSPSPTAQATVVPSPTPAASATTSSTVTTTGTTSGGSASAGTTGSNGGVVVALVGMALILFFIAALILLTLMRRRRRDREAAIAQHRPYLAGPQYGQPAQVSQFGQFGQFNQAGMPTGNGFAGYEQMSPALNSAVYAPPAQQMQQGNYPAQFAGSGISPIPQGNFTPPQAQTAQPALMGSMNQGFEPYRQPVQAQQASSPQFPQLFHTQPTEAYDAFPTQAQQGLNAQGPLLPTCPNCGRPLVPNLPICGVCGMPLEMMRR